ncbi:MAG: hypothetical protein OIN85_08680 [Candidatus Methanoperedens sp.]|nr:hypothetical protein [Candidatus Methanoperedens sp.]
MGVQNIPQSLLADHWVQYTKPYCSLRDTFTSPISPDALFLYHNPLIINNKLRSERNYDNIFNETHELMHYRDLTSVVPFITHFIINEALDCLYLFKTIAITSDINIQAPLLDLPPRPQCPNDFEQHLKGLFEGSALHWWYTISQPKLHTLALSEGLLEKAIEPIPDLEERNQRTIRSLETEEKVKTIAGGYATLQTINESYQRLKNIGKSRYLPAFLIWKIALNTCTYVDQWHDTTPYESAFKVISSQTFVQTPFEDMRVAMSQLLEDHEYQAKLLSKNNCNAIIQQIAEWVDFCRGLEDACNDEIICDYAKTYLKDVFKACGFELYGIQKFYENVLLGEKLDAEAMELINQVTYPPILNFATNKFNYIEEKYFLPMPESWLIFFFLSDLKKRLKDPIYKNSYQKHYEERNKPDGWLHDPLFHVLTTELGYEIEPAYEKLREFYRNAFKVERADQADFKFKKIMKPKDWSDKPDNDPFWRVGKEILSELIVEF